MNITQRITKNFAFLGAGNIITSILGFITMVYLASILGPNGFGQMHFALAIVAYFMLMANLGIPTLGTREIARDKSKIKDYVGNIITLRLTLATIAFGLVCLCAFFIQKPIEIKYLIILYGLGIFPIAFQLLWLFRGIEMMGYIAIADIVGRGCYVVAIFCFIKSPEQLLGIPAIYVICVTFIPSVFLVFFFIRRFGGIRLKFKALFWNNLLRQALPMGFAIIMTELYIHFDVVMLGFMRSNEEVGYYSAAYRLVLFIIGIGGLYCVTIFPIISNYYKTSLVSLRQLLSRTTRLMIIISLPLAVGGTILARSIMSFIYTESYLNGTIALQILVWVIPVMWLSITYGYSLIACDKQKRYAIGVTVGAIINIALNAILIPRFGIIAASATTVVTWGVVLLLLQHEFGKVVLVPFKGYLTRPVIASLGMGAFLYFGSSWNVWVLIVLGALVYFAILFGIGGITKGEIRLIREQLCKRRG